jgi:argininosuccinate lyase
MDAVSDRDFALEAVFVSGVIMTHLSRFCEELVLWANPSMGFIQLSDAFATGSSIMPQKKNPDVAELIRGKTGQVYGELTALLNLLKGLPLCYNRDLQGDKEPFLRADKTLSISVKLMGRMIDSLKFEIYKMREAVREGYLNATELADYLVGKGIAFRTAHHITGQIVAYAESNNQKLEELSLDEFRQFSASVQDDVYTVLDYEAAVARRNISGGTGFESVKKQLEEVENWLKSREDDS